ASVNMASGQVIGLLTRFGGPLESNFYLGQFAAAAGGFQASIWKNVGGAYTLLAVGPVSPTGSGTLEFDAIGLNLTMLLNGQVLTQVLDGSLSSGSVGMRVAQNVTLDNFQVDAVPSALPFDDEFSNAGPQLAAAWTVERGNISVANGTAM